MIVSSKITQDLKLPDGRRSVCEEWTDDEGNTLYVGYACPAKTDIEAVMLARTESAKEQLTAIKAQKLEAEAVKEVDEVAPSAEEQAKTDEDSLRAFLDTSADEKLEQAFDRIIARGSK